MNLFFVLGFTIIIEFFVYCLFIKKNYLGLIFYSVLINSFTNPLANLIYGFGINIFLIELFVFLGEVFLIKYLVNVDYKKAILISFIANLATGLVSLLFF